MSAQYFINEIGKMYGKSPVPPMGVWSSAMTEEGRLLAQEIGVPYSTACTLHVQAIRAIYGACVYQSEAKAKELATSKGWMDETAISAPTSVPSGPTVDIEELTLRMGREARETATAVARIFMEEHSETLPGIIKAIMDDVSPKPVAITINELPAVTVATPHPNLERVLRKAARRDFVWLCGPRGSGKSTAARHVAKALNMPFHIMTGADDQFALIGYVQPHDGSILRTAFREAYENGGLILLDEMDTFNPSAIIVMNDALANGECAFPDGIIKMSPNFYCMVGTNTDGRGATGLYNGRNAIDGATRDRFAFIPWDYAPGLETQLGVLNPQWTKYVQAVRAEMINQSMDETPSPRATMKGAVAINDGDTWEEAAESYIWKGISSDIQSRIDRAVPISQFRN